jgi:hypothetical protein
VYPKVTAYLFGVLAVCSAESALASVSEEQRNAIDGIVGTHGNYVPEEGVYKLTFARDDLRVRTTGGRLVPRPAVSAWAAFAAGIHHDALLKGQLVLLEDEVNPVITAALEGGLQVTGLGSSLLFEVPRLLMLDVEGIGSFQSLAAAFRKALDEIRRLRVNKVNTASVGPSPAVVNAINPEPLNSILSMRGTVVDGIYRAAIGRKALLNGEPVGREIGMSTWVAFAGTNARALAEGEFIVTADELQGLLKALRSRRINIASIRNHTVSEHPRFIFVHFWGEGSAVELAKALRYALDIQVSAGPERL